MGLMGRMGNSLMEGGISLFRDYEMRGEERGNGISG